MAERLKTKEIIIHCSATPGSRDIGAVDINRWHKERGWSGIGYHYVIRRDGSIDIGRHATAIGAHAYGHNATSVGVCLIGGMSEDMSEPEDNFTPLQWRYLEQLVFTLRQVYPDARVIGHNEVSVKACPSFDVQEWAKDLGIERTLADTRAAAKACPSFDAQEWAEALGIERSLSGIRKSHTPT